MVGVGVSVGVGVAAVVGEAVGRGVFVLSGGGISASSDAVVASTRSASTAPPASEPRPGVIGGGPLNEPDSGVESSVVFDSGVDPPPSGASAVIPDKLSSDPADDSVAASLSLLMLAVSVVPAPSVESVSESTGMPARKNPTESSSRAKA